MASHPHLDDDDDFGGDFPGSQSSRRPGQKRGFGDLEDDEDDIFGSKKVKLEEPAPAPGVATGMILSLRESLQNCKDSLETCQTELEAAKVEIQKWHSSLQNESFVSAGTKIEPKLVINYIQSLKASEESLKEQLDKSKKKEAAFIVTFAKREQEIAELKYAVRDLRVQLRPPSMQARKLLLDSAIHDEFTRLKNLMEEKDKKIKELQDNVAAVNFTPQSKMGKMLMAKCRLLQEENEEIGTQANEGKMHELVVKLALQKSVYSEVRSQFEGVCKHMEGLTSDVEKSNEMVLALQEKLEERNAEIDRLKLELINERSIAEKGTTTEVVALEKKEDDKEEEEEETKIPVEVPLEKEN
ncbi:FKBP12-interacting protein of 37 kDa [Impatiens glandulifera]|uniref:FKBP12-interacting protein of 37 kDa n=1 Tax=Impatiens glandulifera TaxID=253017 RepID=UPI001FB1101F|nr:FKBP12-interacting protein of 37 kDa [Impatiens glandulifera]